MNAREKGRAAEDLAADYLLAKGYTLITRRYTTKNGEIDLIALDGETLVFLEIKQRAIAGYAEQSIGPKKLSRLSRAANKYIKETKTTRATRYDIIAIDDEGLRHHENTFDWPDFAKST